MNNEILKTIMPIAGWPESRANEPELTGGTDPLLPTPFRIGESSAATLAAIGLAVSDAWELRTGRKQEISVNARRATASLRSGKYMMMDNSPISTERNTVMGTYPTKDGWVLLVATGAEIFHRLCSLMGKEDWIGDDRFADFESREANIDIIEEAVIEWTKSLTAKEIVSLCAKADVPSCPVNSLTQAAEDPHPWERNIMTEVDDPVSVSYTHQTLPTNREV